MMTKEQIAWAIAAAGVVLGAVAAGALVWDKGWPGVIAAVAASLSAGATALSTAMGVVSKSQAKLAVEEANAAAAQVTARAEIMRAEASQASAGMLTQPARKK